MTSTALMYWNDKLQSTQAHVLKFAYEITGAKTISDGLAGYPTLTLFDAASAQSQIDNFLLTSSEFTAAQFDATSMGTDAFGVIVDMRGRQALGSSSSQTGQVEKVVYAKAELFDDDLATAATANASCTNKALSDSTLEPGVSVGANGNLAGRWVLEGVDAATDGIILVEFGVIMK